MMATKPPPYSPQDALRAQRYYWRSMQRPSIIGPLVLIAIGVVALLVEMGRLSAFQLWDWYVRWWPLLLIAIGLISLGEWWLDRNRAYGRRHRYGGLVALLILLAIFGYANHDLRRWGRFNHRGDILFHFLGQEHDSGHSLNQEIPSGALVDIQAPHGDVTLTPSGDNRIHVQTHELVYASNDADAQRAFDALRPQLTVNGKSVTLRAGDRNNGRTDLAIEIPPDAVATVTAGRGDVIVEDLATPVKVTANQGDIKFYNLKTPADARLNKGDFTAHSIDGDVSLEGRVNNVAISDVKGRVLLNGDFFGDLHVARVASGVHFQSSRTEIELANLPGDLSLDSGVLQVANAAGPIRITTRARDVECTGVTGDIHIENADGAISLASAGQPGATQIENRNGAIHLTLPQDARFALEATARNGEIHSEFDLTVNGVGSGHAISGEVGSGGAKVELTADHGNIRIDRTNLLATTAPVTPAPAGKSIPHLRVPPGTMPLAQTQ